MARQLQPPWMVRRVSGRGIVGDIGNSERLFGDLVDAFWERNDYVWLRRRIFQLLRCLATQKEHVQNVFANRLVKEDGWGLDLYVNARHTRCC